VQVGSAAYCVPCVPFDANQITLKDLLTYNEVAELAQVCIPHRSSMHVLNYGILSEARGSASSLRHDVALKDSFGDCGYVSQPCGTKWVKVKGIANVAKLCHITNVSGFAWQFVLVVIVRASGRIERQ
jgi:hypothetical protein